MATPDVLLTVATVGALAASPTVFVTYMLTRRKVETIHKLVNSRLSAALAKISALEDRLGVPHTGEEGESDA